MSYVIFIHLHISKLANVFSEFHLKILSINNILFKIENFSKYIKLCLKFQVSFVILELKFTFNFLLACQQTNINLNIVNELLGNGADVNIQDKFGSTALIYGKMF